MKLGLRFLLISLIVLMAAAPVLERDLPGRAIFLILSTAVVVSGAYAASTSQRHLALALLLAMPAVATGWSDLFVQTHSMDLLYLVGTMAFYLYVLLLILRRVLRTERVMANEIYGAISVYILLGLVWGLAYGLLETMRPGMFHDSNGPVARPDLFYFSFVTLLTIGYGDISPVTPFARSFAVLEAMMGVMFIAVFVSRLVAMYSQKSDR